MQITYFLKYVCLIKIAYVGRLTKTRSTKFNRNPFIRVLIWCVLVLRHGSQWMYAGVLRDTSNIYYHRYRYHKHYINDLDTPKSLSTTSNVTTLKVLTPIKNTSSLSVIAPHFFALSWQTQFGICRSCCPFEP
jgi:hypothetical protein